MAGPISDKEIACELTKSAIEAGILKQGVQLPKNGLDTLVKKIVSFYQSILDQLPESDK